jgi:rhamnulokinase
LGGSRFYLAIDLGASHGRAVLGRLDGDRLELRPLHEFENTPVTVSGRRCWDTDALFREIVTALKRAAEAVDGRLAGIAVDSWGLDFCIVDDAGRLLAPPTSYRDPSDHDRCGAIVDDLDPFECFRTTGVRFLPIHSAPRLAVTLERAPGLADHAAHVLQIAEYFALRLCGRAVSEQTMLGGCGWCEADTGRIWQRLLDRLAIPRRLFPDAVPPGTVLGELLPGLQQRTGLGPVPILVPAAHDTANIAAAIPARPGESWAFLSAGTWGLMGMVSNCPLVSRESFDAGLTNFPAPGGTFLNVVMFTHLWMIQECRRCWQADAGELSYARISELAREAEPMTAFVDPDHPSFAAPDDMPSAVCEFCRRTGQPVPDGVRSVARVVFESLALRCRTALAALEAAGGRRADTLYVVGGGVRNAFLNQLIADATDRPVATAHPEAAALGNILIQALGTGTIASLDAARGIARRLQPPATLRPCHPGRWHAASIPRAHTLIR